MTGVRVISDTVGIEFKVRNSLEVLIIQDKRKLKSSVTAVYQKSGYNRMDSDNCVIRVWNKWKSRVTCEVKLQR